MIANQELLDYLTKKHGASILESSEPFGLLTVHTGRENVLDILSDLYAHDSYRFRFLTDLCAVHYPQNKGAELAIVYHLHSLETNTRLRIKAFLDINDPVIPTASELFATANWMERETYDFFGVIFSGHPNLVRILNEDEMDYFPMRKEYTLEDPNRRDKVDKMFGR